MNWIQHLEAAASNFHTEAATHYQNENVDLAEAATKDAKAIEQLIDDIQNGKTQER